MSAEMSILDFTTALFRDPLNLRSFVDDPQQALRDAGLPGATPEQVHHLIPVVAESMPLDHPLQQVVHSADPVGALRALDVDDLIADAHDHHREVQMIEKAVGGPDTIGDHAPAPECGPEAGGFGHLVEAISGWDIEPGKGMGDPPADPLPPHLEADTAEPVDHYCDHTQYPDHGQDLPPADPGADHAVAEGFVDTL